MDLLAAAKDSGVLRAGFIKHDISNITRISIKKMSNYLILKNKNVRVRHDELKIKMLGSDWYDIVQYVAGTIPSLPPSVLRAKPLIYAPARLQRNNVAPAMS